MRGYGQVLRRPIWVLRTGVALAAIATCVALSFWQFERTQGEIAVAEAAVSQLVDVEAVLPSDGDPDLPLPTEALGRQVRVSGIPVAGARSYVRARTSPDGETGFLVVDGVGLADGRVVAVVRGWVPEPLNDAAETSPRALRVEGRMQPDENFYPAAPVTVGEPLLTITRGGLTTLWADVLGDRVLVPGYVVATSAEPGYQAVRPVVGADPDVPYPWQNLFYSLQWLIFAGVVVLIWVRWLRDDVTEATGDEAPAEPVDRVSL